METSPRLRLAIEPQQAARPPGEMRPGAIPVLATPSFRPAGNDDGRISGRPRAEARMAGLKTGEVARV